MADTAKAVEVKIKDSVKSERFWKEGVIFLNEKKKNNRERVESLKDYNVPGIYIHNLDSNSGSESLLLGSDDLVIRETATKEIKLADLGYFLIRKAINKLPFYYFDNLVKYFPKLESIKDFVILNKYLADIKIELKGEAERLYSLNLDSEKKLSIAVNILDKISKDITNNTFEYVGTKKFYPAKIKDTIKDKVLKIENSSLGEQEYGRGMRETMNQDYNLDLGTRKWYVYNENYGTSEEKSLIKLIGNTIDKLYKKYEEVYLVRNERCFQIYNFSDGSAMEPDFVLFLREKNSKNYTTYQLFIEAKGGDRLTNDDSRWKEEFLLSLDKTVDIIKEENISYKLVGLPLYNKGQENTFLEEFNKFID